MFEIVCCDSVKDVQLQKQGPATTFLGPLILTYLLSILVLVCNPLNALLLRSVGWSPRQFPTVVHLYHAIRDTHRLHLILRTDALAEFHWIHPIHALVDAAFIGALFLAHFVAEFPGAGPCLEGPGRVCTLKSIHHLDSTRCQLQILSAWKHNTAAQTLLHNTLCSIGTCDR